MAPVSRGLVLRGGGVQAICGKRGTQAPQAAEVVVDGLARNSRFGSDRLDGERRRTLLDLATSRAQDRFAG